MSRSISRGFLLVGVLLITVMVPRPAHASCVELHRIDTGAIAGQYGGPFLVTNPAWGGAGGGEPFPGGLYHYPAWLTRPTTPPVTAPNTVAGYPVDWSDALVDGCVANAGATPEIDGTECTCLLLNDQWNGEGYFSLLSARVNEFGHFDLPVGPATQLATISGPRIMGTARTEAFDIEVDVLADPVTEGVFQSGGCDCGLGYKVYAYLLPRTGTPPIDRLEGWYEPTTTGGQPQTVTPLGQQTSVTIDCDETTQQDFFLSVRLVTDDGFAIRFGSPNSFRIECALQCGDQDTDGDGVHNLCDNCPNDRNPTQSDMDGDDEGDICDLNDGTIYIRFNQPEYVEWQEEAGYSQWNCYRGDLALLRSDGPTSRE